MKRFCNTKKERMQRKHLMRKKLAIIKAFFCNLRFFEDRNRDATFYIDKSFFGVPKQSLKGKRSVSISSQGSISKSFLILI